MNTRTRLSSIGNLRRQRFAPLTMLRTSALMPTPNGIDDPRVRFPTLRVT